MKIVVILAGVLSVVASIVIAIARYEKKRTQELKEIADEMGLEFLPKGDPNLTQQLGSLPLFNQGHSKSTRNVFRGTTDDLALAIFGYRYTTGHGKHAHVHAQTVISFQAPDLSLPQFAMKPEHIFHKVGQSLGYEDIDFESHPRFSRSYLLKGGNEAAIRELFTPEILEFFEGQDDISVQAQGDRMICYRGGTRVKPAQIRKFMEDGFQAYRLFKDDAQDETA